MSYPQGNFYPQSNFHPQGPQGNFYPTGSFGYPQFGYPQGSFGFPQGILGQGIFGQGIVGGSPQQQLGFAPTGPNGVTNSGALSTASLSPQPQHQLLLQLAQYHYWVAQQLTQLAAQQAIHNPAGAYPGQFLPGQMAANFVPGITMH